MKNKNVMINLVSFQSDGREKSKIEIISEGKFSKINGNYEISYEETEATGFEGSRTKLTVTDGSLVTMERSGSASSHLVLERGKKHHCHYGTPYGDFMVGVTTSFIESKLDENGGTLDFKYVIDINSSYIGDYEINIKVNADA